MTKYLSRIETPTESQVEYYPVATKAAIEQMAIFWPAEELGVEEDEADFRNGLTEGERFAVLALQRYLSKIETTIGGDDFWGGRIGRMYPRPEIIRAASVFNMMENNSHAPFYRIGNEVIGVATDEFYEEFKNIPIFNEHIKYVVKKSKSKDKLESTAALTFLEGVTLYEAFAFFKSFGVRGHNKISHFIAGIDGSAKDENFHCMFSAWLVNQTIRERLELKTMTVEQVERFNRLIRRMARKVYKHCMGIIDYIFSYKPETITTITKHEMRKFVRDRVNAVLGFLGQAPMFDTKQGKVTQWFFSQLNAYKFQDFFATTQLQYRRNWKKHLLKFDMAVAEEYKEHWNV
ncbi:ribonucleotide-diphosphate reductase subunit beta [Acinetobacter sp. A47]|uniref:ribonucleotide-diphosphate reductase subunit beta n=1 Tax=Acinetobacter sp. A47 TaxID=1561217 RepID=UPI000570C5DA|nr:ribonucleotide-diphosphate reductase subunit beta [Acinetobacter sp. A47]